MKYEIIGTPLPAVVCTLDANETMITESGSMSWMSNHIKMETTSGGGLGKMFGRMLSGENLFLNRYTAQGKEGMIAFASSFPGSIIPIDIHPSRSVIVQKSGFLAATSSVDISIHFQKKFGTGLFGGEGFIMQKLSGSGTAFIEVDGHAAEYQLVAGEKLVVGTGHVAMMEETVSMEITSVPGVKNMLFGGEGVFVTTLSGPGKVVLQTHPIAGFAKTIQRYLPTPSSK